MIAFRIIFFGVIFGSLALVGLKVHEIMMENAALSKVRNELSIEMQSRFVIWIGSSAFSVGEPADYYYIENDIVTYARDGFTSKSPLSSVVRIEERAR